MLYALDIVKSILIITLEGKKIDNFFIGSEAHTMEEKKSCKYENDIYPHGSEFCLGIYCFRCIDGELHPYSGVFPA